MILLDGIMPFQEAIHSIQAQIGGWTPVTLFGGGVGSEHGDSSRINDISSPANMIFKTEQPIAGNAMGSPSYSVPGNLTMHGTRAEAFHHNSFSYNFSFVDGHVEFLNYLGASEKQDNI